ncbi:hypothetical protein BU24DRAFT_414852 [Aaosphaeria arxii CBS 175.79]|uniref:BTB domain-containing protein n=1 Tax=Aaosphaeria arxii CBS 175.79 TaxID=1450172 RepID=A0A6A5X8Z1_9PLEO|nr:uncharacterized protein BU24DRAFT_414852 [Aaosphaeria arxii CBS 175.79]KAF2009535.1 hypothetical protein BU24DRAFT_414852 [Aaosphaeria arxii CBS 175.79]
MSSVARTPESPFPSDEAPAETSVVIQVPRSVIPLLRGLAVIVKSGECAWLLPTDLLKSHSKFFDKLLTGDHGVTEINLPHDFDSGTFPLFVEYILTGKCIMKCGSADWNMFELEPSGLSPSGSSEASWNIKATIWLYVLAFRLGASKLMNIAMKWIYGFWAELPGINFIFAPYLYAKVASYACEGWQGQTSPLRDLVYHFIFENWKRKDLFEENREAWKEFFQHHPELCVRLAVDSDQPVEYRREENIGSRNLKLYLVKEE